MTEQRHPSWRAAWLPLWLFALCLVYPIPHTMALRNLLLALGLIGLVAAARPWRAYAVALATELRWAQPAGILLAVLSAWMLLQSAFLSPFPERALPLFGGQWPLVLLAALLGLAAARRQPGASLRALTLALGAHIAFLLLYQWAPVFVGSPASATTPFAERDYHSLLNGFLLALLLADTMASMAKVPSPLQLPGRPVWWLLLPLAADVSLRTRNGTVVTATLLALSIAWLATNRQRRLWLVGAAVAATAILFLSVQRDERWQGLTESIVIGATSESRYWLDPNLTPPATPSGQPLEGSAYMRSAWAKQALEAIPRYPLGLGFGHQAFGWAVELKYGAKGMESSHSGWLDFALANGLPGLALWLALSAWLIAAGWRHFRARGDGRGLLLMFSVLAYLLRCLLDGHLSGWRLAMYALLVGTIVGAMSQPPEKS